MKVCVLGCTAGIGHPHRTTSLLLDHDVLIDAGTGVGALPLRDLARIRTVILTHAHLDHIALLPMLVDSTLDFRSEPMTVMGTDDTLRTLRTHVFNSCLWPDYTRQPRPEAPYIRLQGIMSDRPLCLPTGRTVTPISACHSIDAVGIALSSDAGTLVFGGDGTYCDAFWNAVNRFPDLRTVIVECTFSRAQESLAKRSGHNTPQLVAAGIRRLNKSVRVAITHMEPGKQKAIFSEIKQLLPDAPLHALREGDTFEM